MFMNFYYKHRLIMLASSIFNLVQHLSVPVYKHALRVGKKTCM